MHTTGNCERPNANCLDSLPAELWSQHDTDVGRVKSADPVKVRLKPGCMGPYRPLYPLKREAVEGISETIKVLLVAGVPRETKSYSNTPLLPVKKADGTKWRLVHDLRAVNEVVEDMPVEVSNPHTVLTNIPVPAKSFTVIDLCSAFFCLLLAKESQDLFSFMYEGKQYTYSRMPQRFKHSPHAFNQVLKADLEGLQTQSTIIQYVDDVVMRRN